MHLTGAGVAGVGPQCFTYWAALAAGTEQASVWVTGTRERCPTLATVPLPYRTLVHCNPHVTNCLEFPGWIPVEPQGNILAYNALQTNPVLPETGRAFPLREGSLEEWRCVIARRLPQMLP